MSVEECARVAGCVLSPNPRGPPLARWNFPHGLRGILLRKLQRLVVSEEDHIWARKWVWPFKLAAEGGGGCHKTGVGAESRCWAEQQAARSVIPVFFCSNVQPACARERPLFFFPRTGPCLRTDPSCFLTSLKEEGGETGAWGQQRSMSQPRGCVQSFSLACRRRRRRWPHTRRKCAIPRNWAAVHGSLRDSKCPPWPCTAASACFPAQLADKVLFTSALAVRSCVITAGLQQNCTDRTEAPGCAPEPRHRQAAPVRCSGISERIIRFLQQRASRKSRWSDWKVMLRGGTGASWVHPRGCFISAGRGGCLHAPLSKAAPAMTRPTNGAWHLSQFNVQVCARPHLDAPPSPRSSP